MKNLTGLLFGVSLLVLLAITASITSCARSTKLVIEAGTPPRFVMSGTGSLGTVRIRGPLKQREALGEDAYLYWTIVNKEGQDRGVERLGAITYGKVPEGYKQVYPEGSGTQPPPLIEGERYNIRIATADADGVDKFFILRNGKVEVTDY